MTPFVRSSGDLTQSTTISLSPSGPGNYVVQAGIDLNGDGTLEPNEVTRTINIHTIRGDLAVLEDDGTELDNSLKVSQGDYVLLNNDNDSYTFDSYGNPMSDVNVTNIPTEADLVPIKLHALTDPSVGGTYTLSTASANIRLWREESKATPVTSTTTFDATKDSTVWVEGVAESGAKAAEQVVMKWSKPGVAPITVDKANYTVFSMSGPQNVPGYTTYDYSADVPGGFVNTVDTWHVLLGTIVAESSDASGITVGWGSGPTVGTVQFSPAADFRGERDVYVVQINLASTGNTAQYADRATAGPFQPYGAGSALIRASSAPSAMVADIYISSIVGPSVDGQQRGIRFMQVGLIHEAQVRSKAGLYDYAEPPLERVSSLQDGLVHFDAAEQSTLPWVFQAANSYRDLTTDNPVSNVHLHTFDNPTLLGTDMFTIGGVQVNALAIDFRSWVYLGVRSKDPDAGSQVTERAVLNWDANLSGAVDASGVYTPTGSGITGDGAFQEVTDGTLVPDAAANFNEWVAGETWETLAQ